jgi:hypothetical protein
VPSLVVATLLLELVFRVVTPANDPPLPSFDETTGIYHLSTDRRSGVATFGPLATGRARWRINEAGWNSPVGYRTEKIRATSDGSDDRCGIVGIV